jgi:hypothetical protein
VSLNLGSGILPWVNHARSLVCAKTACLAEIPGDPAGHGPDSWVWGLYGRIGGRRHKLPIRFQYSCYQPAMRSTSTAPASGSGTVSVEFRNSSKRFAVRRGSS